MSDSALMLPVDEKNGCYEQGVALMHKLSPRPISQADAQEAVRNLMAFGRLALEISRGINHDSGHGIDS